MEVIPWSFLPFILLWENKREPKTKCKINKEETLAEQVKWGFYYYSFKSHNLSNSLWKDSAFRLSKFLFILSCEKKGNCKGTMRRKKKKRKRNRDTHQMWSMALFLLIFFRAVDMQKMTPLVRWLKEKDYFAARQPELRTYCRVQADKPRKRNPFCKLFKLLAKPPEQKQNKIRNFWITCR